MKLPAMKLTASILVAWLGGCGSAEPPAHTPVRHARQTVSAITALQAAKFDDAAVQATAALAVEPHDSQAAAVRAIATYQAAGNALVVDLGAIIEHAEHLSFFDHEGGRAAWRAFADKLDSIDRDLAVVAADPGFSLELCLACWEHDWNRNGKIDERDLKLFEIEYDGKGGELAANDPRRRPTFRFDVGDADWARAMVAFQRAAVDLVLAYRWSELDKLLTMSFLGGDSTKIVIHMIDPGRVKHAREKILAGLEFADRSREAYLAETDDDREWVPNPKQKSHPIPLEVDAALYDTWAGVTGDVRRMLQSQEGVSLRDLGAAIDKRTAAIMPDAYVDFGRMLMDPTDITVDLTRLDGSPETIEKVLRGVLGNGYATKLRASPLVGRLRHMKDQLDHGEDTAERKLRYLLWLN